MKTTEYTLQIVRSQRKTMALEITASGSVVVRAPKTMPEWRITEFVNDKKMWIEYHLKKKREDCAVLQEQGRFTEEERQRMVTLAKDIIPKRVAYYAKEMQVTYGNISIRKQKSRWGSCSRQGNLNFNCLLAAAPLYVLDYVVVHELSHRLEMNHSARFWSRVETFFPDYKEARKWLYEYGNQMMLRMHGIGK